MRSFFKIFLFIAVSNILFFNISLGSETNHKNFESWLLSFKSLAIKKGISEKTLEIVFKDVKFLEQVIKYDRKQPEFMRIQLLMFQKEQMQELFALGVLEYLMFTLTHQIQKIISVKRNI